MIMVTVEFADDVAPAVERWSRDYADQGTAAKWAAIMERLHPGAKSRLEWDCAPHGREPLTVCGTCGWPVCRESSKCECEVER